MRFVSRFAVVLTCAAAFVAAAQNATSPFVQSFCVKVQAGKNAEFIKLISEVSKPVAQVRADAGEFATELITRSVYPAGQEATCDYNIVRVYSGFPPDPKTRMNAETAYEKAHVAMKPSEFIAQRDAVSRLRKSELWRFRAVLGHPEVGNYLRQNYVKVDSDNMAAWLKLERETFQPVHQARIEIGAIAGWAVATLTMPSGSALPYNGMTVDVYKDWSSLAAPNKYQEAFQKTNKGEMSAAFAQSAKLRGGQFVRTELYEVVEAIRPRQGSRGASSGR